MTEIEILNLSKKYLEDNYSDNWEVRLSKSNFFWNDDIPLKEVLVSSNKGLKGYLLVSTSQSTPFLISKSFNGDILSELLQKRMINSLNVGKLNTLKLDSLRFYYEPPFNFIVRDVSRDGLFADLNKLTFIDNLTEDLFFPTPINPQNLINIKSEWDNLGSVEKIIKQEKLHISGPYYNQAFNSNCTVSGCSPVGWSCYAGWLKMSGLLPNLFQDNACWYEDWDEYYNCMMPIKECNEVNNLIWWFNSILGTVNGSTNSDNIIRGQSLFTKYGNPEIVMQEHIDCSIETINSLIQNYAILFCAQSNWNVGTLAGHSVVLHGVKENEILVNMGWGKYTQSRWFNINSMDHRSAYGLYIRQ